MLVSQQSSTFFQHISLMDANVLPRCGGLLCTLDCEKRMTGCIAHHCNFDFEQLLQVGVAYGDGTTDVLGIGENEPTSKKKRTFHGSAMFCEVPSYKYFGNSF